MVQFHEHIITDLLEDPSGGLVILSSGLCLPKLISSLLLLHHSSQGTLLILSSSSSPYLKTLILHHHNNHHNITEITADLPAHHRLSLYTSGEICFITPRILIVDLLTNKIPVSALSGIIILNAHSLSETSTEAFIVRILKTLSQSIYVRAFTDKPHAMVMGFSKTERIMKALYIKKLHLWPRFQVYVSEELERAPPEVVDVRVGMSKYMIGIQKAIIEVMDACLKEMRKTNKVDVEDLSIENESSFKIFDYAKKRVYRLARSSDAKVDGTSKSTTGKKRKLKRDRDNDDVAEGTSSTNLNGVVVLEEVLEAAPKWKVLRDILQEIEEEIHKQALLREDNLAESEEIDDGIVLVACKDERSCMQLEDFIMNGAQKVLREEWEKYLLSKVELHSMPTPQKKKPKPKESKGFGILDGVVPVIAAQNAEASSINKQENDALLAAVSEIRNQHRKDYIVEDEPQPLVDGGKSCKTWGKGRNKRGRANPQNSGEDNVNSELKISGYSRASSIEQGVLRRHTQQLDPLQSNAKQIPSVHFYAQESDQPILDILKPSVIIVYHPDMTFVREIEVYKAENPSKRLRVYFLFYEDSTEVQKFEAGIRRENGAFESLIRQKSMMMIPVDQNMNCLGLNSSVDSQPSSSLNAITRKAGGRKEVEKEMQVIVDMREFMSSLPNVLHQKGMRIIPVTLEVGDYILSPLICVERKSIQDLFMSFTSGRLYHQVETMTRYYRIPVLLIEFSQDKSFSFQSASDISDDVTPNSIISKLSLLALHFPRLRIIWSRSLHATADIFAALKANQDEPDEARAMRVGVPSEEGIIENDVRAENYNTSAVEFLRRLPGVTDSNYRAIMDGCKSLAELALLPMERLTELMGGQKAARTLRDFLDAKYPALL
ncbi:DNA repair endonuclease xp-f / mei-9 / rad1, putative [Ricinus communis]|uniref:DNA repair endonuclease xp-f / mei-9 / rad1, putative n=1 Tax=Ricinus communis TaxID=3988 RepID=B9SZ05_RICCO|nr:DNA repair endonuclease xp-f / mei-9 / rad1, putative [Ricinus communis]